MNLEASSLRASFRGQVRQPLERGNEFRPAIRIAAVIDGIRADENVRGAKHLTPGERVGKEDRVSPRDVGDRDFAQITIEYVPAKFCVESKSLKFYLASYRNERAFNETVTNRILDDFVRACSPREAVVTAEFSARGGIALTVRAEYPDAK